MLTKAFRGNIAAIDLQLQTIHIDTRESYRRIIPSLERIRSDQAQLRIEQEQRNERVVQVQRATAAQFHEEVISRLDHAQLSQKHELDIACADSRIPHCDRTGPRSASLLWDGGVAATRGYPQTAPDTYRQLRPRAAIGVPRPLEWHIDHRLPRPKMGSMWADMRLPVPHPKDLELT